jgi:hypothetical protein
MPEPFHLRIRKHPEPESSDLGLRKLLEQVGRVGVMDVIVPASVGEQEVGMVERRDVVHCRVQVPDRVFFRRAHVTFGIDGIVVEPVGHCKRFKGMVSVSLSRAVGGESNLVPPPL